MRLDGEQVVGQVPGSRLPPVGRIARRIADPLSHEAEVGAARIDEDASGVVLEEERDPRAAAPAALAPGPDHPVEAPPGLQVRDAPGVGETGPLRERRFEDCVGPPGHAADDDRSAVGQFSDRSRLAEPGAKRPEGVANVQSGQNGARDAERGGHGERHDLDRDRHPVAVRAER
ncbi:hypothetical protein BRC94_01360 [Halobacteriales archaeon QS_5_70_17]|nr:MAG: hypothetical protein BRC94_01360 [Halobacteriales archaeon QS_5_70_17]